MTRVAPTAYVDPQARIGRDVDIAPGCYVGPNVVLGDRCRLLPNVTITGHTQVGADNLFYPGAVIGCDPQDLKYRGGDTRLVIGDHNVFRELVTVHRGTEDGGAITQIGSHNQFQVSCHIAHDVLVGDHCVLSNTVQIAGHVAIEDHVNISGLVGVQQFVTLGRYAFIAGLTRCTLDVPPYTIFAGYEGAAVSVNEEGLRRWGFTQEQIDKLWGLYKLLYSKRSDRAGKTITHRIEHAESNGPLSEHERYLLEFVKRSLNDGKCGRYLEAQRAKKRQQPVFYHHGAAAS